MKIIKALQKHVQTISKYQKVDLDKEIDKFISENQNLSEVELLDKIYSIYGSRIKFLEDATQCKAIINIKEWGRHLRRFLGHWISYWGNSYYNTNNGKIII